MFCGNCGGQVKEGARFCSKCGKPLESVIEEVAPKETIPTQPTQQPAQFQVPPQPQVTTQPVSATVSGTPYQWVQKGSFWPRVAAAIIDGLILMIVYVPLYIAILAPKLALMAQQQFNLPRQRFFMPFRTFGMGTMIVWSLVVLGVNAVYFIYFVGSRGQTPGKMLLNLKIVPASGGEMDYGKAVVRYIAYYIPMAVLSFIPCVGQLAALLFPLWVCWDNQHQGLHDKIANTYVIRV